MEVGVTEGLCRRAAAGLRSRESFVNKLVGLIAHRWRVELCPRDFEPPHCAEGNDGIT